MRGKTTASDYAFRIGGQPKFFVEAKRPSPNIKDDIHPATQREDLRARLIIRQSATQLQTFLQASVHLMQVLARACGHDHLNQFVFLDDLTTWNRDTAYLTGVAYGGVTPLKK